MVAALASTATGTAVGYPVTASYSPQVGFGRATATGYAALGIGAPRAPGAVPDALRLEVLTSTGTQLINDLPTRRGLTFSVEHNGSGTISFDTDASALPGGTDSVLLDPSNLIRVHYGDLSAWPYGVAEGFITSTPPTRDDSGRWSISVQCPGTWDVLDMGVLYPPAGATGDQREFSYTAGQTGPAWVPEEWGKPKGSLLLKSSFRWKHRWPRGWPESRARWIWSSSPDKNSPEGTRYFVGTFTLAHTKHVHIYAAGDDNMRLYLNGARLKVKRRGGWKRATSMIRTLKAGTHTIAAQVANMPGGDNKSGFIFAAAQLKADGTRDKWLLRSSPDTFQIRTGGGYIAQVPLPPDGWYPAAVLWVQVAEAAARGVDFHASMVRTFSTTADSTGVAWTVKGPSEYDIGTSGAQLGETIRALGVDVAMLPGLRLSAWRQRGFDLRNRVTISAPQNSGWTSRGWPRVRTVGITHQDSGWTETLGSAAAIAEFGRRELTLSAGGQDGDAQADVFAAAAMDAAASPEETVEVAITSADIRQGAPQPFRDFNVADVISVEAVGGFLPIKVMTITGAEQDGGLVTFTIAGYPV